MLENCGTYMNLVKFKNSTTHTNNGWNLHEPSQIQAIECQRPVTKKRGGKVYINTNTRISTNLNIKCVIFMT